jgi:hypothetical protein
MSKTEFNMYIARNINDDDDDDDGEDSDDKLKSSNTSQISFFLIL